MDYSFRETWKYIFRKHSRRLWCLCNQPIEHSGYAWSQLQRLWSAANEKSRLEDPSLHPGAACIPFG
ncbi:predicted protein [Botrytis cinerea T4]|uniref:Uncharacterized protein n=1 Tax=Botryotinia fuckeliana (strain T4) TaxID=999810 RepID=G2Y437_BOTF4|nr:predicted protein [Botrytis cinerea T4]